MKKTVYRLLATGALIAAGLATAPAQAASIFYQGQDIENGVNVNYSIETDGTIGYLTLANILSSSITFAGTAASPYGAFTPFTSNNNLYFLNTNEGGMTPVSASASNLYFNFAGPGGALNMDTEECSSIQMCGLRSNAPDSLSGLVYAFAARGVNDGDATVYNHGDLATKELDDTNQSFSLQPGTFTPQPYANEAFATATDVTGAVPEPAAWMMMILGMGAIGYTMRRRKAVISGVQFA